MWKDTFKMLAFITVLLEIASYMPQQTLPFSGFQFVEHITYMGFNPNSM
jgi:hypothetical protein